MSASALALAWLASVAFFPAALALAKERSPIEARKPPRHLTKKLRPVRMAQAVGDRPGRGRLFSITSRGRARRSPLKGKWG
jgi:hypothetical protein